MPWPTWLGAGNLSGIKGRLRKTGTSNVKLGLDGLASTWVLSVFIMYTEREEEVGDWSCSRPGGGSWGWQFLHILFLAKDWPAIPQHLYLDQGKPCPLMNLRPWHPWHGCAHALNACSHRHTRSTQAFFFFLRSNFYCCLCVFWVRALCSPACSGNSL